MPGIMTLGKRAEKSFENRLIHQVKSVLDLDDLNMDEQDDRTLVSLALTGDARAFEKLVRRYQKLVYNILFQMVRTHESAADLTQETFLKCFRALSTFRTDRDFKPWLLRIARNSALNLLRDKEPSGSLDSILSDNPSLEPVSSENLETDVEWRISQQELFSALERLPLKQREVFILRYQHDLSYDQIMEITGNSVSSIKSLLFRARENLRTIMLAKDSTQG